MPRKIILSFCLILLAIPAIASAQAADDVESFIRQDYPYGLSCSDAKAFGPTAVPVMGAMLNNPDDEPYWQNVVLAMGCIGDPAAVSYLQAFLDEQKQKGDLTFAAFAAVQNVPTALALLAQQGHAEALTALTPMGDEDYWRQAKFSVFDGFGDVAVEGAAAEAHLRRSTTAALELTEGPGL